MNVAATHFPDYRMLNMEEPRTVNILLDSFPGISASSRCLQSSSSETISDLYSRIEDVVPVPSRLLITTNSNRLLSSVSKQPISSLVPHDRAPFLSLRVSVPLCGGKGGFGSQLRAAGGRMSSQRKRKQGENNGSNRNLDGRRLRTVNEAKALAEYLAVKPEMEKREKEERRKRWESIVEAANEKEEEMRSGAKATGDAKMGQWVQDHDEMLQRTREYAQRASKSMLEKKKSGESSSSSASPPAAQNTTKKLWGGWDEDEGGSSSDSEDDVEPKADLS